ncbi:DNA-binding transcriptional regulator, MerR family [Lachnospiraceae bacterium XBB1006]|nr:DNA-binding transcriptional regulator, MerR family [Lachnospiraceae bacterium XBB1006]
MKIKEVEALTGVKSANIRYYESKELLIPLRGDNNYREYTKEDVAMLQRIKVMRLLGISVDDIRKIKMQECSMDDVVATRLEMLEAEERTIKETKKICQTIVENHLQMEDLSENMLGGDKKQWEAKMRHIRVTDMDKLFLLKGMLLMGIFPILYWLTTLGGSVGNYLNTGNPNGNRLVIGVGIFLLVYGLALGTYEGYKGYNLSWVMGAGKNWAAPGLGILSNGFTISGMGLPFFGAIFGPVVCALLYLGVGAVLCSIRIYFIRKDIHPIKRAVEVK